MSRTKNSVRNIFFGAINRIISIFIPFIFRTIIIKVLGEDYLGLNSLFSSILQVLNVAELGFESAITASLYKPIAENDIKTVSALLNLYKKTYKMIGSTILIIGIGLIPFIEKLINGVPPQDINIYFLYSLHLSNTVISYFFFSYKITLINANQRMDIVEKVSSICKFIICIFQVFALIILKSITIYILLNVVFTLLYNLSCAYVCDKKYPQYKYFGKLDYENKNIIKKNIFALSIQKIGSTISISLDTIIISTFLNLATVSIYGNYNYIISAISVFVGLLYTSITASIGNSIVLESREKNYYDFKKITFMNTWLIGWCSICFLCLFQNFIILWLGNKYIFSMEVVIPMIICFYFTQIRKVVQSYKDAAGMWWEDKFKPLVGCIVNLVLNIYLVRNIGVSGVIISTIISYIFIELPWETHILFKKYFMKSEIIYYLEMIRMSICIIVAGIISYIICESIPYSVLGLMIRMIICVIVPNIILVLLNYKKTEYNEIKRFFGKYINPMMIANINK